MREIDFDEIKEIWRGNKAPTQLYVHSPFCKSICKYCVYRGCLKDKNFDRYFNEYLPKEIERYLPIINNQDIKEIYFGGGTSNYIPDLSNLEPTFEKIRHIKPREKVIELHFQLPITDETINKVIGEGFNTVILCIQTFNKDLLKRQNRACEVDNDIESIIAKFHKAGVRVASDFLFFPNDEEGLYSTLQDMRKIAQLDNPLDEISLGALYQEKANREIEISDALGRFFRQAGFEFADSSFAYPDSLLKNDSNKDDSNKYVKEWESLFNTPINFEEYVGIANSARLFRVEALKSDDFFRFVPFSYETRTGKAYEFDSVFKENDSSVIGIGSYRNGDKNTWSRCGSHVYHEVWDGEEVRYFLTAEKSFYQKAHDFLNWMEKVSEGKEPDMGTELTFRNFGHMNPFSANAKDIILNYELSLPYYSEYIENICRHEHELENFYE